MTDMAAAGSPNTDPQTLEMLAQSSDDLAVLVAVNPNASQQTLIWLSQRFPQAVLENPALDLHLLENPGFLSQLASPVWHHLLDQTEPPAFIFEAAAMSPDIHIRIKLAEHPKTPTSVLEQCEKNQSTRLQFRPPISRVADLLHALAKHPNASEYLIIKALPISLALDPMHLRRHPNAPTWLRHTLKKLFRSEPGIHAKHQDDLIRLGSFAAAVLVARYPHADRLVLDALARYRVGEKDLIQLGLVNNPNTAITTLERLCADQNREVRQLAHEAMLERGHIPHFFECSFCHPVVNWQYSGGLPPDLIPRLPVFKKEIPTAVIRDERDTFPIRDGVYALASLDLDVIKVVSINATVLIVCRWSWRMQPDAWEHPSARALVEAWAYKVDQRTDLCGMYFRMNPKLFRHLNPIHLATSHPRVVR
jgi:hypothetical protein